MRYTHYIYDFDGTLYDSYGTLVSAFVAAAGRMGVSLSEDRALVMLRRTLKEAADALAKEHGFDVTELMAHYRREAEKLGIGRMSPYPGARDFLAKVKQLGGHNHLYTHRDSSAMEALRRDGMLDLFDVLVTDEDGFSRKPAPDALLSLMNRLDAQAGDCLMLGDRAIDMLAASNAGVDGALFDPEGFYQDFPADHRFADWAQAGFLLKKSALRRSDCEE